MEGVGGAEEGAEFATCFVGLGPAICGEFYAVVWDGLVDVAVLWICQAGVGCLRRKGSLLFPSDWAWRTRIII